MMLRTSSPLPKRRPRKPAKTRKRLAIDTTKSSERGLFHSPFSLWRVVSDPSDRCELFNKAYNHISDRIDQVYKDLTKGKAAPMGGVAYLSLEDNEVSGKLAVLSPAILS
jgi:hypothetical protein